MIDLKELKATPHRRFNPLTRTWVLVSPHRTERPWQGMVEASTAVATPHYDPQCYLCPGNERAGGGRNPQYGATFAFDNDYPALLPESNAALVEHEGVFVAAPERGRCRVVCFSPRHDLSLGEMQVGDIRAIVDTWADEFRALGDAPWTSYVQIFENRGAMMGASNPHPHCQIWTNATVPDEPAREQESLRGHQRDHGQCLLCTYATLEQIAHERSVYGNEHFVAVVPFWAVWPFEVMVIAKRHIAAITDLQGEERDALADMLQRVARTYDRLFGTTFPYSMGLHQRPTDSEAYPEWHLHAHYYPPLLRSATVRKFMVGYEMLCMPQRDITPEVAAERLRDAMKSG